MAVSTWCHELYGSHVDDYRNGENFWVSMEGIPKFSAYGCRQSGNPPEILFKTGTEVSAEEIFRQHPLQRELFGRLQPDGYTYKVGER